MILLERIILIGYINIGCRKHLFYRKRLEYRCMKKYYILHCKTVPCCLSFSWINSILIMSKPVCFFSHLSYEVFIAVPAWRLVADLRPTACYCETKVFVRAVQTKFKHL